MAYVNKKAQLHTPEGTTPAYNIFPVIVLDGIYDSLANAGNPTYKIMYDDPEVAGYGKIKEKYLSIMGSTTYVDQGTTKTGYYVLPQYLPMLEPIEVEVGNVTTTSYYVKHSYLDILDANGKIDTQYLPSYVDDVVSVTVFSGDNFPTTGTICIREMQNQQGGTIYKFYTRPTSSGTWDEGVGETSKIYMDPNSADNALYRCDSTDPQYAVKISENPYIISQTKTNGVYLNNNAGTITACAQVTSRNQFGTVKVTSNTNSVNGVYLNVSDGVISVGATLATGQAPGTVITAGSTVAIADLTTAGYAAANIVPTANFMVSYVAEQISTIRPVVAHATTADYGIVRISPTGHINVDDGVISVSAAGNGTFGVVCITGDMVNAVSSQDSYAVTLSGIRTYVSTALSTYQIKLNGGDGIAIDATPDATTGKINIAVDLVANCALTFTNGKLDTTVATDIKGGVVCITDLSSDILAEKSVVGTTPLAVTPNAVKDYVDSVVGGNLVPAGYGTMGAVYIQLMADASDSDAANLVPKAADVRTYIGESIETLVDNIEDGTVHEPRITTSTGFNDLSTNGNKNATVTAISGFVSSYVGTNAQKTIVTGVGLSKTYDSDYPNQETLNVIYQSPITTTVTDSGVALSVSKAGTDNWGVVKIGGGIDVSADGVISVETGINDSAGEVTTSNGSTDAQGHTVPLGGVRVWADGGIDVENGVLKLNPPSSTTFGGVMLISANALTLDGQNRLQVATGEPLYVSNSAVRIRDAARSSKGAVAIITSNTQGPVMDDSTAVPFGADVVKYVTSAIAGAAESKLGEGTGIDITPVSAGGVLVSKTISVDYEEPIIANGGKISVRVAQGDQTTALTSSACGAVWVRTSIRDSATIATDTAALRAGTVPTEQAVRTLMDTTVGSLKYLEYDIVED